MHKSRIIIYSLKFCCTLRSNVILFSNF